MVHKQQATVFLFLGWNCYGDKGEGEGETHTDLSSTVKTKVAMAACLEEGGGVEIGVTLFSASFSKEGASVWDLTKYAMPRLEKAQFPLKKPFIS